MTERVEKGHQGEGGDVLTSIRRFVAEETPREAGLPSEAPFVLTADLRIGGDEPRAEVDDAELSRRRDAVMALAPAGASVRAAEPGLPAAPAPTALADEEALRALVSEVVREELRGALGDRITRNVRRMVRREIAMELGARTLD